MIIIVQGFVMGAYHKQCLQQKGLANMALIAFNWVNSSPQRKTDLMSFQIYSFSTCVHRCPGIHTPHTTCILDPAARGL